MLRKIIKIDEEKCNGCGACASACHEGAIAMVDGIAKLIKDDYCDGLGDCLPACPTGAITFEEREAAAYDEAAVKARQQAATPGQSSCSSCPGTMAKTIDPNVPNAIPMATVAANFALPSQLAQWPIQIKLAPINAPFFTNANLLVAADCTAFAYGDFHNRFIKNHITLIGCPKLDEGDYSEKLTAIIKNNSIKSVTVVRMEVPCCGGMDNAVIKALRNSGKMIPWQTVTISSDGRILE